nr:aminotransferase class V-fold PLP-dependent enzyme [uncultured Oscillibacter sp.]
MTRLVEGGDQEQGRRAGTENVPAIIGVAAALEEACTHMAENTQKVSALRNRLIAGLSQIPDAVLNGDPENRLPGNVNFSFEWIEGESLVLLLDRHGICASTGSACTAQSLFPSHMLLAIGRSHAAAAGALRLSLSEDNTHADVDEVLRIVPGLVRELRGKRGRNPFQRPL